MIGQKSLGAFECAAITDLALEFGRMNEDQHAIFQSKLANLGRMLSGVIRYWEKNTAVTGAATPLNIRWLSLA